ncbi:MAG: hypothetical protein CO129_11020 [Ignavibacteriales bacterium CG_4_9_14_3_um_filter_34_10]|nr:MAG: hypothetical protein CO129_11020 [Ignavibacteriales bacterium CG_4_9_14_3_um_filter_34_10]
MKKAFYSIFLLILFVSLIEAGNGKKYGKEISLKNKTKVSDILANPSKFEGKKVLVEGTIVGVCETRGCWIELSGDKDFQKIKVKVNDGEIVFPLEVKGKKALVEGEVYSLEVEKKSDCSGKCNDEKKKNEEECEHGKQKEKVYQIKGFGAKI